MLKNDLRIDNIPSILWGPTADKLIIAVHGKGSNKSDFDIIAEVAIEKGYQILILFFH